MNPARPSARPFLLVGLAWLVIALVIGASGRFRELPPPGPQLILGGLTIAVVVAALTLAGFRSWLFSLGYRQVIALHLTRFVGVYFLVLYGRGELPHAFAVYGGWGDIIVAALALVLVLLVPRLEARSGLVALWNTLGFIDLLFVVGTATRLMMVEPASMSALLQLPLSLLPTFLVPVLLASHVILFWRLWVERPSPMP
jgi:hypothetical protein